MLPTLEYAATQGVWGPGTCEQESMRGVDKDRIDSKWKVRRDGGEQTYKPPSGACPVSVPLTSRFCPVSVPGGVLRDASGRQPVCWLEGLAQGLGPALGPSFLKVANGVSESGEAALVPVPAA